MYLPSSSTFKTSVGIPIWMILTILLSFSNAYGVTFPGRSWEHRAPEEFGIDGSKLDKFAINVGGDGVIVKDGYIIKTWGSQTKKSDWASAAKPVISTLLFFAIEEGKLSGVDDLINPYILEKYDQNLIDKDLSMTFSHLANMVSGYSRGEEPGKAWAYNGYAMNLYATLLFKEVFNASANDVALDHKRLAALQFQDGSLFGSRNGYGISTSVRDFARIGLFWLNKGFWDGTQILPEYYFNAYMKSSVSLDLPRSEILGTDYQGANSYGGGTNQTNYGPGIYGFNWWFNDYVGATQNRVWPAAPVDTFQANGHWDREVMTIIPSFSLVVAAQGNWGSFEPGNPDAGMNQNLKLLVDAMPGTFGVRSIIFLVLLILIVPLLLIQMKKATLFMVAKRRHK